MCAQVTDMRVKKANRVTWVGFCINFLLTVFKMAAGVIGHSSAMIADAVHSLSDFATDIVLLLSFRVLGKPVDHDHDYGHGKYETLAAAAVGIVLAFVGGGIIWNSSIKIWAGFRGIPLPRPGVISFVAAVVSVVVNEWLYRFTMATGREIDSQAVIANAWHHHFDALSSVATTVGIGGALVLGDRWHVLDPIAAVVVSVFIMKVAWEILRDSAKDLTEGSLEESVEKEILKIVSDIEGTVNPHNLRTRRIGNYVAIDIHVRVDGQMCVTEAHGIATKVESKLRERFGEQTLVSVHIEPFGYGVTGK